MGRWGGGTDRAFLVLGFFSGGDWHGVLESFGVRACFGVLGVSDLRSCFAFWGILMDIFGYFSPRGELRRHI